MRMWTTTDLKLTTYFNPDFSQHLCPKAENWEKPIQSIVVHFLAFNEVEPKSEFQNNKLENATKIDW